MLEIRDLTLRYGQSRVLHGTDLDVTLVIKDWQPRKLGQ